MKLTKGGKALYMHCLPADISGVSCKEGEVADSVFERYRIETYKEAGYKPFVIAAMMLTSRFKDPAGVLAVAARSARIGESPGERSIGTQCPALTKEGTTMNKPLWSSSPSAATR